MHSDCIAPILAGYLIICCMSMVIFHDMKAPEWISSWDHDMVMLMTVFKAILWPFFLIIAISRVLWYTGRAFVKIIRFFLNARRSKTDLPRAEVVK